MAQLNRGAVTDSAGRFVIDSVPPGDWSVAFSHPALDSLGVIGSSLQVRVFAGASATVTLATPAFKAIRDRMCGDTPDSLTSTVAFGNVHAADGSRVRVSVSVTWMRGSMPGEPSNPGTVRTIPDGASQVWVACGIPRNAWFHASVRDSARVASAFVQMGPRDLAVRNLVLSAGVARLQGTVSDPAGNPVPGAHLSIEGTAWHGETDAMGVFVMPDAPNGTMTLDVRAAGFSPWVTAILGGGGPVTVRLRPIPPPIEAEPGGSDYLRLLQRSAREGVQLLTAGALSSDSTALTTLPLAGTCRWWLDGRPVEREFFAAQPRWSWRALELYPRGQDAPPEYRSPGCPIALLWTTSADW